MTKKKDLPVNDKKIHYGAPFGNTNAAGGSGSEKIFETPDDLQKACQKYFDSKRKESDTPKPFTLVGLALGLGVTRQTLLNYSKEKSHKEYHPVIQWAKQVIEEDLTEKAVDGTYHATFTQFLLCNNNEYENMNKIDHTTKGEPLPAAAQINISYNGKDINLSS